MYQQPPGQPPGYPPQQPQQQVWSPQPTSVQHPGQPPQGYPPQQHPGYPPQGHPQQPPQGAAPSGYGPQQQAPLPQAGPPPSVQADDEAIRAAHQAWLDSQPQRSGGAGARYFKWLGPQGETQWSKGMERTVRLWICQWHANHPNQISITKNRHRYMEGGKVRTIDSTGEGDLISAAKAMAEQIPHLAESVKNWGRMSPQHYYQVFDLDAGPHAHLMDDGTMRPLIFGATSTMHKDIMSLVTDPQKLGKMTLLIDPTLGRPILATKKKTGFENRDVEYSATYAPSAMPLPQEYWAGLHNLWDLNEVRYVPSEDDQRKVITLLGWPQPPSAGGAQVQVPQGYNPNPMPPSPNPYQQPGYGAPPPQQHAPQQGYPPAYPQPQPQGYPQPQAPQGYPPPQQPTGAPPPPQAAHPGQHMPPPPPPATAPAGPPAPMGPPPPQMPAPQGAGGPPPPMTPPPVTTSGPPPADAQTYAPQPGAPAQVPPPPGGDQPPFDQAPAAQPAAPALTQLTLDPSTGKLPAGVSLEKGRERCFGSGYAEEDFMCKECPEWIKSQCKPLCGVKPTEHDAELANLENQLEGGAA